jgi:hypothetical protein
MVVEAALRAGLRVRAGPHTHVHGVDGTFILASGELMAGEKSPQGLGVDPAPIQRGVKTAPAATMRCFKTQVDGGRDAIRGEYGIGEFEEGVRSPLQAVVVE